MKAEGTGNNEARRHSFGVTVTVTHDGRTVSEIPMTISNETRGGWDMAFDKEAFERGFRDFATRYLLKFVCRHITAVNTDNR